MKYCIEIFSKKRIGLVGGPVGYVTHYVQFSVQCSVQSSADSTVYTETSAADVALTSAKSAVAQQQYCLIFQNTELKTGQQHNTMDYGASVSLLLSM